MMHTAQHNQNSRHDACARVCGGAAFVTTAHVAGVAKRVMVLTAKINPRWASGGLLMEGNS